MSSQEEPEAPDVPLEDSSEDEPEYVPVSLSAPSVLPQSHSPDEYLEPAYIPKRPPKHPESKERLTSRYMTKYEKARVLGIRALQIARNAEARVQVKPGEDDSLDIAEKELKEGKTPFVIRRYLPDGTFEDWKLAELVLD